MKTQTEKETPVKTGEEKKLSKRGGKGAATRGQLLDAALTIIGEKGYSAATVDEIVGVASVSKGVAYYHFKSKAAMAESILQEGINRLIGDFEVIAGDAPDASQALTGMIECFAGRIFENKAFGRFFVSELWREGRVWSDSMRVYEHRLLHLIEGQLSRGQSEGSIRLEIDPAFVSVALLGMVLTTTLYYLVDELPTAQGFSGKASVQEEPSHAVDRECSLTATFSSIDQQQAKDAFIERICDFVRHANAPSSLLS